MTRKEAIAIICKEYLCVDRECDIERNCDKCDLMMPSKEPILQAFKMAMAALERMDILDKIKAEIEYAKKVGFQRNRKTYDKCLEIIDKYREPKG